MDGRKPSGIDKGIFAFGQYLDIMPECLLVSQWALEGFRVRLHGGGTRERGWLTELHIITLSLIDTRGNWTENIGHIVDVHCLKNVVSTGW